MVFFASINNIFRSNIWGPLDKLKIVEPYMFVIAIPNMKLLSASFSFKSSGFWDFFTSRLEEIEVLSIVLIIMLENPEMMLPMIISDNIAPDKVLY